MRTMYLFIIILVFSMTSSYAFACGGGGGDGDSSSGSINVTKPSSTVPYHVSGNTTKNSRNIWDRINEQVKKHRANPNKADKDIKELQRRLDKENAKKRIAEDNAKPNKKIDEIIHYMKMKALLGPHPNSLKKLEKDIQKYGKKQIAALFVFSVLLEL